MESQKLAEVSSFLSAKFEPSNLPYKKRVAFLSSTQIKWAVCAFFDGKRQVFYFTCLIG